LLWYVCDDGLVEDVAGSDTGGLFRRDTSYFTSPDRRTVELTINLMRRPEAGSAPAFIFEGGNPALVVNQGLTETRARRGLASQWPASP